MIIRQEKNEDYPAIRQIVTDAFLDEEHTDHDEQNLVERIRESKEYIPALSLVAEEEGKVVGHIMFSEILIGEEKAVTLAPLAVAPGCQGTGVGGTLIREGHKSAKELGFKFSVVLGHPGYYPKFGYVPASEFGIKAPFEVDNELFMALPLTEDKTCAGGVVKYSEAFGL